MATGSGQAARQRSGVGSGPLVGGYRVLREIEKGELGGLPACAAEAVAGTVEPNRRTGPLVALRCRRDAPPPAQLGAFAAVFSTSLLMPLAHGAADGEYWIVCDAPPGPCFAELFGDGPIGEAELLGTVLKPLAHALQRLHASNLCHRGIRAGNLFRIGGGHRVVLGPGWTMPPGFAQGAVHEPVGSAACHPAARGTGTPADDVYALGVLLLELALGRTPLAELDADEVVFRKLEFGSFAALLGNDAVPPGMVPILRAMLADHADARPTCAGLAEHGAAAERPKGARPAPRSHRRLAVGRFHSSGARPLGFALSRHPREAMAALRDGTVSRWLARGLDQPALGTQLDTALRAAEERPTGPGDAVALQQVGMLLDPEAPLLWQNHWLWPDGIATLLAAQLDGGGPDLSVPELVRCGGLRWWGLHGGRGGLATLEAIERRLSRINRQAPAAIRMAALAYAMNPLLPCASPLLGRDWVLDGPDLLAALERRRPGRQHNRLLDGQMLALLIGRGDDEAAASAWSVPADADEMLLDLVLLGGVQKRSRQDGVRDGDRSSARWLASEFQRPLSALLDDWPGRDRRQRRQTALDAAVRDGDLVGMLDACCRHEEMARERAAFETIREEVAAMRRRGSGSGDATPRTMAAARGIAADASIMAGVVALLTAAAAVMLPS